MQQHGGPFAVSTESAYGQQMHLQAGPSSGQDPLLASAQTVEDVISKESQAVPDLEASLRGMSPASYASAAALILTYRGPDAPVSSVYMEPPNPRWDPFTQRKTVSVPAGLLDSYAPDQRPRLGLLPELGRAWIAVEHRLFLWDYSGNSETGSLLTYDDETEPITAVGLVMPRKAVFLDTIRYILVICTAISVRLVGLQLEPTLGPGAPRLVMYDTDRKIGTDGIAATSVCGTPDGRIFITCEDGSLREVEYRAETSWLPWQFTALTSITVVSAASHHHRSLFGRGHAVSPVHTLLAYDPTRQNLYSCTPSVLEAWSLGTQGTDRPHKIASVTNICAAAQAKCPNSPMLESASFSIVGLDVVAKNESGTVAVVLTTSNCVRLYFIMGYAYGYYAGASASQLTLIHVRLPPTPAAAQPNRPPQFGSPSTSHQQYSQQTYVLRDLRAAVQAKKGLFIGANEDRVWFAAVHETARQTQPSQPRPEIAMTADLPGGTFAIAEVIGSSQRREFVALNSSLAVTFAHNRPVDTLANVLEGGDRNELQAFATDHTLEATCAWALSLACDSAVPQDVANAARRAYHEIGSSQQAQGTSYGPDGRPAYSPRFQGFAIYLGRLLSPLWRLKVTTPLPNDPARQISAVPDATLLNVQRGLNGLKMFADSESSLFAPLPAHLENRPDTAILKAEQASFVGLRLLLVQATEALSFVLLLVDFHLSEILASCPPDLKQSVANLTYKDLLALHQGRDVVRKLVHVIINHRIAQGESVDSVSDLLEQRCGSFCSAEDILVYKGTESLRVAHDVPEGPERNRQLRDSLHLFLKASKHIDIDKLREICSGYVDIGFFSGGIELSLACALSTTVPDARTSVYDCALQTLSSANDALDASVAGTSQRSVESAELLRDAAFQRALGSDDEDFLFRLFKWYLDKRLIQQLLDVKLSAVERFLMQPPASQERYDLLWQLYVRRTHYASAARVLAMLADSEEFNVDLERRLEYLSLAAGNARSEFPQPANRQEMGDFLISIDEKLEVAQVQLEIARAVSQTADLDANYQQELLENLDRRLYTISELFNEFAQPLNMLEIMLLIFYVSEHHDADLVTATWGSIFAREVTKSSKLAKIRELGRRFYPSESVFPVDLLVSTLEESDMKSSANATEAVTDNIADAFLDAGVPYEGLARAYVDLFNARIPPWHTKAASEHLVRSATSLFERWLKAAHSSTFAAQNGDYPASDVLDQVDRFAAAVPHDKALRERLLEMQRQLARAF